jgi:hypothetical protein
MLVISDINISVFSKILSATALGELELSIGKTLFVAKAIFLAVQRGWGLL